MIFKLKAAYEDGYDEYGDDDDEEDDEDMDDEDDDDEDMDDDEDDDDYVPEEAGAGEEAEIKRNRPAEADITKRMMRTKTTRIWTKTRMRMICIPGKCPMMSRPEKAPVPQEKAGNPRIISPAISLM